MDEDKSSKCWTAGISAGDEGLVDPIFVVKNVGVDPRKLRIPTAVVSPRGNSDETTIVAYQGTSAIAL